MTALKDDILSALRGFVRQRPGMDPDNYRDWNAYRRDAAEVTRELADFNRIASAVGWSSITGEALLALGQDSGRLELSRRDTDGTIRVQYKAVQQFSWDSTENRYIETYDTNENGEIEEGEEF